ncbi:hypothetical protein F4781DRAFT_83146 [Annulohypoxylon bovei var. microspora]|nr:hypothetical protein F4781DRAFT_83146 [Annulohypoxylon bovei var. microspora]
MRPPKLWMRSAVTYTFFLLLSVRVCVCVLCNSLPLPLPLPLVCGCLSVRFGSNPPFASQLTAFAVNGIVLTLLFLSDIIVPRLYLLSKATGFESSDSNFPFVKIGV